MAHMHKTFTTLWLALCALFLTACSGGDLTISNSAASASVPTTTSTASSATTSTSTTTPAAQLNLALQLGGQVFKGPIGGARVCLVGYALEAGACSATAQINVACAQTDATGAYQINTLPSDLAKVCGPFVMRADGGTYIDEATGQASALSVAFFSFAGGNLNTLVGLLDSAVASGVYVTAPGSGGGGGGGLIVDEGDGGPFVGTSLPTTNSNLPTKTFSSSADPELKSGNFNISLLSTLQVNMAQKEPGGLTNANAKTAQTQINNAFGLPSNLNLSLSSVANGSGTYAQVINSLATVASSLGVGSVVNSNPSSASFQTAFAQAQSQASGFPSQWIFVSPAWPNGTRTVMLPTGEIPMPGLGMLSVQRSANGALRALAPTATWAVHSWLEGRVLAVCNGTTLMGSVAAPTANAPLSFEAGYEGAVQYPSRRLGCGSLNDTGSQAFTSTKDVGLRLMANSATVRGNFRAQGGAVLLAKGADRGEYAVSELGYALLASMPEAALPPANYLLWVGGNANATDSYGSIFSSAVTQSYVLTGNTSDTTSTIAVYQNAADGRAFARGLAVSGRAFASAFVEPSAKVAMLCERDASGRLFGASAMTAGAENASTPVAASAVFGRNWRLVQACALSAGPSGAVGYNYSSTQGWQNTTAPAISAQQMANLLLPSSSGIAAANDVTNTSDTLFYSAFNLTGGQLVMVERRIATDGKTRDIRLFYTAP